MTDNDPTTDDLRHDAKYEGDNHNAWCVRMIRNARWAADRIVELEEGMEAAWSIATERLTRIAELEAELDMCTADCAAARQDRLSDD